VSHVSASGTRLLANSAYRAVAEVGSKLASLALFAVMARKLGDEGFGVFTFALALVMLVTAFGNFGQDGILTREVARDQRLIHHYFGNTIALKTLLALPAVGLVTAVAVFVGTNSETVAVILLLGVAVVVEQYAATCFGAFQAHDRIDFIAVVLLSQRITMALVGVAALLLGADVVLISAVYLGCAVFAVAVALRLLIRRVVRPRASADPGAWWPLMRVALPLGIATVFSTVLFRIDIAILALFASDAVVGQYGGAFRLFETTLFLSWSVGTATYPVFSRLSRTTDPPAALVLGRGLKLVVAATLPLAVGAALLAEPVITLFYGSEFEDGAAALALLAPAIALFPIAHIAGGLLVAQDRQMALAVVYGVVAVQNVVGNFILVPFFSLEGAAIEASLTQLLLAIALVALAVRTVGRLEWGRILAGPALAAAVAAVVMLTLSTAPVAAGGLAGLVYAVVLVVFERSMYPDDASAVRHFVRRPRVAGSPPNE
jgi:O-antigen/teichoic acid export membrane protein